MANVISLHTRQLMLDGALVAYGTLQVYESGTLDQVAVYADTDLLTERSQPIPADANGVLPPCYVASSAALRLLAKDEDGNALPGYPMDDILPEALGVSGADQISASPFEGVTGLTVQAQLEEIHAVAAANDDLVTARLTPWTTGGSGNAFTITPTPAATTYAAGQSWIVRPNRSNTGAATLNVSGLGTRNLKKYGTAGTLVDLAAGEIQLYREFVAYDDGTQIVMLLGRDYSYVTTNANGSSERFASGLQICTRTVTPDLTAAGPDFYDYAQAFTAIPNGSWSASRGAVISAGSDIGVLRASFVQASTDGWYFHHTSDAGANPAFSSIRLTAIGRWY